MHLGKDSFYCTYWERVFLFSKTHNTGLSYVQDGENIVACIFGAD